MAKEKAFSFDKAEDSPGFLLWQVTNLWQREIKKVLEVYDVTHSQFVLLASTLWLSSQKESITQVELSAHTKIDPMSTSTILRALQAKGLIKRQEHLTDTRAKTIMLTETGKTLTVKAVKSVELFDSGFFSKLGEDLKSFNSNLGLLMGNMK